MANAESENILCLMAGRRSMARTRENGAGTTKAAEVNQEANPFEENKQQTQQTLPVQFEVRIHTIRPDDAIKANASVNINGAFAIRGVKVVEGNNGLFVSMPSYKAGNEYKNICFPVTAECRQQLHDAVLGAYEQAITQSQSSVQKHQEMKQQAPEGQTVDMAGMQMG